MGREAVCTCDFAGEVTEVKALLEAGELILRGGLRKRISFAEIQQVKARGGELCFTVAGEAVQLVLGPSAAAEWAAAITTAPPSLSRKLGITNKTVVRFIGQSGSDALKVALADAAAISSAPADPVTHADLLVACVDSPESLAATVKLAAADLNRGTPIWIVYPKGPGHALNETTIRTVLRSHGWMDTKVASVSGTLTALRFCQPKKK